MNAMIESTMIDTKQRKAINHYINKNHDLDVDKAVAYLDEHVHTDKELNEFMECIKAFDNDVGTNKHIDELDMFYFCLPYTEEISYEYFDDKDCFTVQDAVQKLSSLSPDDLDNDYINHFYYMKPYKVNNGLANSVGDDTMYSLLKPTKKQLIKDLREYQRFQRNRQGYDFPDNSDNLPLGVANKVNNHSFSYNRKVQDKIWDKLDHDHPTGSVVQWIEDPAVIRNILKYYYPEAFA